MKICILIPAHNESETIGSLVGAVKERGLDVVVIDDGSGDNSGEIAKEKGAHVIRHEQKQGKGASLSEGFKYILKQNYTGVITMDGDGQHDPDDLDFFFKAASESNAGVIVGNRMHNAKKMPLVRYLTNRFMSFIISFVCHQSIKDTQCGYRYIRSDVLRSIKLNCNDFEIETEILIKAAKKNYIITSVPVQTIYRSEKSSINPIKDTIRFFKYFFSELWTSKN